MQLELQGNDEVILKLSFVDSAVCVTLMAAETNGIWIKAEDLYERLPGLQGRTGRDITGESRTRAALFVPFTHVQYVLLAPGSSA